MTPTPNEIVAELARIKDSFAFRKSAIGVRILEYLISHALNGSSHGDFKEMVIGTTIYGEGYDPMTSPKVRLAIGRLRVSLMNYYDKEGEGNLIRITIGSEPYLPKFVYAGADSPAEVAAPSFGLPVQEVLPTSETTPVSTEAQPIFGYAKPKLPVGLTHSPDHAEYLQGHLIQAQATLLFNTDLRDHLKLLILANPEKYQAIAGDSSGIVADFDAKIAQLQAMVRDAQEDFNRPAPPPRTYDGKNSYLEPDTQEGIEETMRCQSAIVNANIALYSGLERTIKALTIDDDDDALWLVRDQLRTAKKGTKRMQYLRADMERKLAKRLNPEPEMPWDGIYRF